MSMRHAISVLPAKRRTELESGIFAEGVNMLASTAVSRRVSSDTAECRSVHADVLFFPLSWTIVHPIDEASPLNGKTNADLVNCQAEFLILLTGLDETFNQSVHSRSLYRAEEVTFGARFVKMYELPGDGRPVTLDVELLSRTQPAELPGPAGTGMPPA
jgi:hypothetical protein